MIIKPYGDTVNDGSVQLSFTLPLPFSEKAKEAARKLTLKWGFSRCEITEAKPLSKGFTFFVAYAHTKIGIDASKLKTVKPAVSRVMDFDEVNAYITEKIGRPLRIVGACTGSDAHTVGIDAIMNMKGYNHHYGLERYPMVKAYNLGAQVENEKLIAFADKVNADAVLVSQVVTQRNIHMQNMREFVKLVKRKKMRKKLILIAGGPRMNHKTAVSCGFDAGFGKGSYAEHVATFVAGRVKK